MGYRALYGGYTPIPRYAGWTPNYALSIRTSHVATGRSRSRRTYATSSTRARSSHVVPL